MLTMPHCKSRPLVLSPSIFVNKKSPSSVSSCLAIPPLHYQPTDEPSTLPGSLMEPSRAIGPEQLHGEYCLEGGHRYLEQKYHNHQQETRYDFLVNATTQADSPGDEILRAQLDEDRRRLAKLQRREEAATSNTRAARSERRYRKRQQETHHDPSIDDAASNVAVDDEEDREARFKVEDRYYLSAITSYARATRKENKYRNRQRKARHGPSVDDVASDVAVNDEEDREGRLHVEDCYHLTAITNHARATRSGHRLPLFANNQSRYRNPTEVGNDSQPYYPNAPSKFSSFALQRFLDDTTTTISGNSMADTHYSEPRIAICRDQEYRERMVDGNHGTYAFNQVNSTAPQTSLANDEEKLHSPQPLRPIMRLGREELDTPSRYDGFAASDTLGWTAYSDLNLINISNLEIEATHGNTTEATGQPRSPEVQTRIYPHVCYSSQTGDFRPISAPPQSNTSEKGPNTAILEKATSSTAELTRLNSESEPIIQTGRSAWTSGEVMMFDHIDCIDESKKKATDQWFRMFKDLVLPMFPEKRQQRPVKIAVLDTGIDLSNPAISLDRVKIKDKRSFVPNEDWTDRVGHGTQVALLLLRMAYNAHIYVARVARGRMLDDPAYIAEALRYATESWQVDIINMSFGFDSDNGVIGAAIKNAYAANVLMFAAARNDGGNFGVAFPARHKDVICISATDGYGTASSFNPPVFDTGDNFATIGESLEFRSFRGDLISMSSGTSYATPVAVSIACLVLEYVREKFPDGEKNEAERRLKESPDGMRAALHLMSYRLKDHRYIAPWKLFNAKGENNVYIHLSSALKNPDI